MRTPPRRAGARVLVTRAKDRSASSRRWLERQLNDPYVSAAKSKGYRSRAAFKLADIDDKFGILKPGALVLDLGAAPGGWSQIAAKRVGGKGRVIAADILELAPIPGVITLTLDLQSEHVMDTLRETLGGLADVVLSDMAAATTGHKPTDQLRTEALFESALAIAEGLLKPGGSFIGKVFQGGATQDLLARAKRVFRDVRHAKPPSSRSGSSELYLVALGYQRPGASS